VFWMDVLLTLFVFRGVVVTDMKERKEIRYDLLTDKLTNDCLTCKSCFFFLYTVDTLCCTLDSWQNVFPDRIYAKEKENLMEFCHLAVSNRHGKKKAHPSVLVKLVELPLLGRLTAVLSVFSL